MIFSWNDDNINIRLGQAKTCSKRTKNLDFHSELGFDFEFELLNEFVEKLFLVVVGLLYQLGLILDILLEVILELFGGEHFIVFGLDFIFGFFIFFLL